MTASSRHGRRPFGGWLECTQPTSGGKGDLARLNCLGYHDGSFYWRLARQARNTLRRNGEPASLARFDRVMLDFDSTVAHLTRRPRTLVHGSPTADNIMVQPGLRIRPIDWESTAVGVGAGDVAKLLAGWGADRPRLTAAYLDELASRSRAAPDEEAFETTLGHCRILRRLRFLYWWKAPCGDPLFVNDLLDGIEDTGRRLRNPRTQMVAEGAS